MIHKWLVLFSFISCAPSDEELIDGFKHFLLSTVCKGTIPSWTFQVNYDEMHTNMSDLHYTFIIIYPDNWDHAESNYQPVLPYLGVSRNGDTQNGWFIVENFTEMTEMDDLGVR